MCLDQEPETSGKSSSPCFPSQFSIQRHVTPDSVSLVNLVGTEAKEKQLQTCSSGNFFLTLSKHEYNANLIHFPHTGTLIHMYVHSCVHMKKTTALEHKKRKHLKNYHVFVWGFLFVQLLELPIFPFIFQLTSVFAFVLSECMTLNAKFWFWTDDLLVLFTSLLFGRFCCMGKCAFTEVSARNQTHCSVSSLEVVEDPKHTYWYICIIFCNPFVLHK